MPQNYEGELQENELFCKQNVAQNGVAKFNVPQNKFQLCRSKGLRWFRGSSFLGSEGHSQYMNPPRKTRIDKTPTKGVRKYWQ